MPSFDIVSEINMQEVRHAVENATRDISTRWDFRQVIAHFEFDEKQKNIKMTSKSDFQVKQLLQIMIEKLAKRGIEVGALDTSAKILHSGKTYSLDAKLKQGIDAIKAKKLVKLIKDSQLKVQAQIQGDQLRVTGKSRNDLQAVISFIRDKDLEQPFQFNNFRD